MPAHVLARPLGVLRHGLRRAVRLLGGSDRGRLRIRDDGEIRLCMYADEAYRPGDRLEIEVLPPRGRTLKAAVEVAWVDELPPGGPAERDVGVTLLEIEPVDLARLDALLSGADAAPCDRLS